jgi:hypothetical protein
MKGISIKEIRNALRSGSSDGYVLFKEIREEVNINKVKTHPVIGKMAEELLQYADSVKNEMPQELSFESFIEFLENGNRYNYEKPYFNNKKDLHSLVMAEILENNGDYIKAIEERLWRWCNIYTWELPAHVPLSPESIKKANIEADEVVALFSAETGFYFAEILSIIGHKLHPLLVYRLRKEIFRRIIDSYKNRAFHWEESAMNWASVCSGAVGCAALYLVEDINELSVIVHRIIGTMESYLSGFDKDGITTEGLGYWSYGFSFYVYFAELLKERTNGKLDLMIHSDLIRKISEMPLYMQFPDGSMINFSDAPGKLWYGDYGLLSRLGKIFNIKEYKLPEGISIYKDHTSKWAITSRNLFWGLDGYDSVSYEPKTGCFYFPESQWVIDRRLAPAKEFYAFAAKGGYNDEPHNHNDIGHFILHFNGDTLLCDLGAPEYTKQFFGAQRYTFLHTSSKGHSVPVINGNYQGAGAEYKAKVINFEDGSEIAYFLDLTDAYGISELESYTRKYLWNYSNCELEINDSFTLNKDMNTVEEVFITQCAVEAVEDGVLCIKGKNCCAKLFFDDRTTYEAYEEKYTDHFGQPDSVNRIVIKYNTNLKEFQINIKIKIECM